jgi:leucine dehydrogenase
VGAELAQYLADVGASVRVADVDASRARAVAARLGGEVLPAERVFEAACDVFAPCAVGGVLGPATTGQLRCRIVAGSANNQLAAPEAAEVLKERGILYAPDYVINAGGAIALVGLEQLHWSQIELDHALTAIGETLLEIYRRAEAEGVSTADAADALAQARLLGSG